MLINKRENRYWWMGEWVDGEGEEILWRKVALIMEYFVKKFNTFNLIFVG